MLNRHGASGFSCLISNVDGRGSYWGPVLISSHKIMYAYHPITVCHVCKKKKRTSERYYMCESLTPSCAAIICEHCVAVIVNQQAEQTVAPIASSAYTFCPLHAKEGHTLEAVYAYARIVLGAIGQVVQYPTQYRHRPKFEVYCPGKEFDVIIDRSDGCKWYIHGLGSDVQIMDPSQPHEEFVIDLKNRLLKVYERRKAAAQHKLDECNEGINHLTKITPSSLGIDAI